MMMKLLVTLLTFAELLSEISGSCVTVAGGAQVGATCVFPFTSVRGKTYTSCTTDGGFSTPWCSTKVDSSGKAVKGNWGNCPTNDQNCYPSKCTTTGGAQSGAKCIFPFTSRGKTYTSCTTDGGFSTPWCSTKVDSSGNTVTGNWGECPLNNADCPNDITDREISLTSSKQFAKEGLEAHNKRRDVPLKMSDSLCEDAQNYANQLAANDAGLIHASAELRKKGQGENLAWASPMTWSDGTVESQNPTAEDAVKNWYDEKYTGAHCMGHYTQVVWKGSRQYCMAKAESKSKATYTVARYFPAGNFVMNGKKQEAYADNVGEGFQLPAGC